MSPEQDTVRVWGGARARAHTFANARALACTHMVTHTHTRTHVAYPEAGERGRKVSQGEAPQWTKGTWFEVRSPRMTKWKVRADSSPPCAKKE